VVPIRHLSPTTAAVRSTSATVRFSPKVPGASGASSSLAHHW
jgi:hypothetical protein